MKYKLVKYMNHKGEFDFRVEIDISIWEIWFNSYKYSTWKKHIIEGITLTNLLNKEVTNA